ncbi:MAG: hypothetical protein Q8K78_09815 [Planctomycetaceae bacterium]|nr:hypothetical protein [Planctomycetaceae bacterium]
MRRTFWLLALIGFAVMATAVTEAGPPVHTPRKYEFPATGHWGYRPTWRDQDPNQLDFLERQTFAKSLRKEAKFRNYFGDYVFMRSGTEMQYTWDVPSYKRSVR